MTDQEIQDMLVALRLEEPQTMLVQTHISWVFLQSEYAYKVKKGRLLSFLDFSTPQKRLHALLEELRLNRRLAPDVYLEVVAVCQTASGFGFCSRDSCHSPPIDHALKMKRLDNAREMHLLLDQNKVEKTDIIAIAQQVAQFHLVADKVTSPEFRPQEGVLFRDLRSVADKLEKIGIEGAVLAVEAAVRHSDKIWDHLLPLVEKRHSEGLTVDGHGDLHSGNIFLLDKPVLFDCIEFDQHLRILDVLSELAFLASDLIAHNREDLAELLVQTYQSIYPVMASPKDHQLFAYYIWYRLNVRLKVSALKLPDEGPWKDADKTALYRLYKAFTEWSNQRLQLDGTL